MTSAYQKPKPPSKKPANPAVPNQKPPRSKGVNDGMEGLRAGRQPKPTPTVPPTRVISIVKRPPKRK